MEYPIIDYARIGKRIKAARKQRGISQQALAEIIACTPSYISYIETGVRSMSLDTFILIANALDISSDRKSTRLNSSHAKTSRMPSSA